MEKLLEGLESQIQKSAPAAEEAGLVKNQAQYVDELTASLERLIIPSILREKDSVTPLFVDPRIPPERVLKVNDIQHEGFDVTLIQDWKEGGFTAPKDPYLTFAYNAYMDLQGISKAYEDLMGEYSAQAVRTSLLWIYEACTDPLLGKHQTENLWTKLIRAGCSDLKRVGTFHEGIARYFSEPAILQKPSPSETELQAKRFLVLPGSGIDSTGVLDLRLLPDKESHNKLTLDIRNANSVLPSDKYKCFMLVCGPATPLPLAA